MLESMIIRFYTNVLLEKQLFKRLQLARFFLCFTIICIPKLNLFDEKYSKNEILWILNIVI